MNMTERDIARKMGKVVGDCRLGDDINEEVGELSEYRLMDQILRNTVDSFNESVFVINTLTEQAVLDDFGGGPRATDL